MDGGRFTGLGTSFFSGNDRVFVVPNLGGEILRMELIQGGFVPMSKGELLSDADECLADLMADQSGTMVGIKGNALDLR